MPDKVDIGKNLREQNIKFISSVTIYQTNKVPEDANIKTIEMEKKNEEIELSDPHSFDDKIVHLNEEE